MQSVYANCLVKAKIIEICVFSSVAFTQLVTLTYFSRFVIGGLWYIILPFNVLVLFLIAHGLLSLYIQYIFLI